MSPTIVQEDGFRFYFFSREEARMHVHVNERGGEAKIWLEPAVEVAENHGLRAHRLNAAVRLVRKHENAIRKAWYAHFGR